MTALVDAPSADRYDVVVAGSGAPALMAAAVAAERGLTVLVLERSGLLGGTSSISAGTVWVPCNPYQPEAGVTDHPAAALEYLTAVASGRGRASVLGALVDHGAPMLEFARDSCGLVFDAVPGAGGTLGPALTMAYLAGQSVGAGTAGRRAATSMARRQ